LRRRIQTRWIAPLKSSPTSTVGCGSSSSDRATRRSRPSQQASVDYASQDELVEKYRPDPGVDVSGIEEVDVVWDGGPLEEALPTDSVGTFDAFIASHVLEHIPDPIGLLQSLEKVLKPSGVVSLAIPDKRFCFDFFRPLSTIGELLSEHERRATRHARKTLFDFRAYFVTSEGESAWGRRPVTELAFSHSLADAKGLLETQGSSDDDHYVDAHGWQFTPSSFQLAMLELAALQEIDFTVDRTVPTEGFEFYVTLRRGRRVPADQEELQSSRLDLLRQAFEELGEQVDLFIADPTPPAPLVDAGLEHELDALREERDTLLRNYELAMSSKSWRLTASLRRVGALLRR
jgi:SAM-dependent methyltransferase